MYNNLAGLDEGFMRDMERHRKQEYELLQKIAMKQSQIPTTPNVLGNLNSPIPSPAMFPPSPSPLGFNGYPNFYITNDQFNQNQPSTP